MLYNESRYIYVLKFCRRGEILWYCVLQLHIRDSIGKLFKKFGKLISTYERRRRIEKHIFKRLGKKIRYDNHF